MKTMILGQAYSIRDVVFLDQTDDAKSYKSTKNNVYPMEKDIANEMCTYERMLKNSMFKFYDL